MIYIAVICWIKPEMGPAIPKEELAQIPVPKRIIDTLKFALPPLALILAVLGAIFFGVATPTEAAGVGSAASFLMILIYRKFEWRNFKDTIFSTGKTVTMVITILIGATTFTGVFLTQGGGKAMVDTIMALGLGPMGTYWMMQIIYIILGCFIDWIGIIMITFPIFLPIAKALGFDTLWFTAMLAINLQMSFLTPPFGYALFYLSGMGLEGIKLNHIYRGVIPFLLLQLIGVMLCTYWPEIVVWLPNAMLGK
jgi:tripartite ATP-independent transporter DctM subunit